MLREKLKLIELLSLCGVAAIQVSTIGVNRFLKVIIDRYVFMYAQVVLRYPPEICAGDWMMRTLESESDLIL
jgi:hypothetical protein